VILAEDAAFVLSKYLHVIIVEGAAFVLSKYSSSFTGLSVFSFNEPLLNSGRIPPGPLFSYNHKFSTILATFRHLNAEV